jgi:hypothetical protein
MEGEHISRSTQIGPVLNQDKDVLDGSFKNQTLNLATNIAC